MCEVTRQNFEELYPQIIDDLHSATFISVDCEFSGLFDHYNKCSLFDTPNERFKKLQSQLENYLILQFGLSTFKYERTDNTFNSSTYNFYLLPSSLFKTNSKFTCQINSIEFLCKHEFDFNKLFHDGIHFLNKVDEKEAFNMIEENDFINSENSEDIQKYCSLVAEWVGSAGEGHELVVDINNQRDPFIHILHQEIRKRFQNVWTYYQKKNAVCVKKVKTSENRRLKTDKEEKLKFQKKFLDSLLGFSRILKELENLQKPIIGHNFLIDLVMIYKQFYNPSPVTYKQFKENIIKIFPNLYDTKNISFHLREILSRENTWKSNSLSDLYEYFKTGKGLTLVVFTPLVNHKDVSFLKENNFHQAGFDSYCTGFCFLKMAHVYSLWNATSKTFSITSMHTSSSWLLGAVASMKNRMNIARAQVDFIVLDGQDPKSTRPGFLYIQSKTQSPLDVSKVSEVIAKFTSVDIQPLTKYSGLMAVGNARQARDILNSFEDNEEFFVTKYNFLKHSKLGKALIPAVIVSLAVLAAILHQRN